jgi:hypothetical protein
VWADPPTAVRVRVNHHVMIFYIILGITVLICNQISVLVLYLSQLTNCNILIFLFFIIFKTIKWYKNPDGNPEPAKDYWNGSKTIGRNVPDVNLEIFACCLWIAIKTGKEISGLNPRIWKIGKYRIKTFKFSWLCIPPQKRSRLSFVPKAILLRSNNEPSGRARTIWTVILKW